MLAANPAGIVRVVNAYDEEPLRRPGRLSLVLSAAEAHPVVAVLLVAVIARLAVAGVVTIAFGGSLFLDDASYSQMAAQRAAGLDAEASPAVRILYDQTATYLVPVTLLYRVFGPVVLLGQLVAVAFGSMTAVLATLIGLEVGSRRLALIAGLIVALLPSQVLWSSLTLKDSGVWVAAAGLGLVVAVAGRVPPRWLAIAGLAAVGLLFLLGHVRPHSVVLAAWALMLSGWVGQRSGRPIRVAGVLAIGILTPLMLGLGPAGWRVVTGAGSFGERRALNAEGMTAIDDPARADLDYLPRGLSVMLAEPYPWSPSPTLATSMAKLEAVVWYPIVVFAVLGLRSVWTRRQALLFPVVLVGGVLAVYALSEGNFGTAFRHRAEMVWPMSLLAAAGLNSAIPALSNRLTTVNQEETETA